MTKQMEEIWKHWPEYPAAREWVQAQSLEDDLKTIDSLFGRENLKYGDTPEDVKAEALRQIEIEWRSERNESAELHVKIAQAMRGLR